MKREEVYSALDSERAYQSAKWGSDKKQVGSWLTFIRHLATEADKAWATTMGDAEALDFIRKIGGTVVACLEQHGCEKRELPLEYKPLQSTAERRPKPVIEVKQFKFNSFALNAIELPVYKQVGGNNSNQYNCDFNYDTLPPVLRSRISIRDGYIVDLLKHKIHAVYPGIHLVFDSGRLLVMDRPKFELISKKNVFFGKSLSGKYVACQQVTPGDKLDSLFTLCSNVQGVEYFDDGTVRFPSVDQVEDGGRIAFAVDWANYYFQTDKCYASRRSSRITKSLKVDDLEKFLEQFN